MVDEFVVIGTSITLFAIGVYGLLSKRNLLRLVFSIEILINAATLNFIGFAVYLGRSLAMAQTAGLIIIALAAAEAAAGLALILESHRITRDVVVDKLSKLRG